MKSMKELGNRIKNLRKDAGLSKPKASKLLGYKSNGTIDSIEQGKSSIPVDKIPQIAKLYNVPIDDFLEIIKEFDPQTYNRYMRLKKCLWEEFLDKIKKIRC
jgi:transcriptional regulator with XRE-family HTH domain